MNTFVGILLFVAGIAIGTGMLTLHNRAVKRAVESVTAKKNAEISKLRLAYTELQENAGIMQHASDCADAFKRGKTVGRQHPMSDAERFAQTFEGRRAQFASPKGGAKSA